MSQPDEPHHEEFVSLYELYLHIAYHLLGRPQLARTVAAALRDRDVSTVLDCAAGTGFPSLDLASDGSGSLVVHCCDADPRMLAVLCDHAGRLGVDLGSLMPPTQTDGDREPGLESLVLNWRDLGQIDMVYDLVMCRGNSLVYANTWGGGDEVAPLDTIKAYLSHMADRVRDGGFLLVDAPWQLAMGTTTHGLIGGWSCTEEVHPDHADETDRREWWVHFRQEGRERPLSFRRYSSALTVRLIQGALLEMGFEETTPIRLEGERTALGTIIARKTG